MSEATVGRVLADVGVRPHKVRGWLKRADDPAFWAQAGRVSYLYLAPEPGAVLVSIDEKAGIQAKTRIRRDTPGGPARPARREFEYPRHGTVSIIAAMNVRTGEVITRSVARNCRRRLKNSSVVDTALLRASFLPGSQDGLVLAMDLARRQVRPLALLPVPLNVNG